MRVDEDVALTKSIDVTDLLVGESDIALEAIFGYSSWFNGNNDHQNIIIHNMARENLIESNQHANEGCCVA